ncbi:Ninjurin domain containing protein [Asbolus verrucosus]|uniref:Ninjurin domain containing protein n=1 Tax=Asbolus verrucosus TaxID=1661398 RepID=A0A482VMR9_ASBVE|nr:Ninjurin domain containing protein [Asbolus verrucosus]
MAEKVPSIVINEDKPPLNPSDSSNREAVVTPNSGVGGGANKSVSERKDDTASRAVPDGGSEIPEDDDGIRKPELNPFFPGRLFPYAPSSRHDLETGSFLADGESIPDVNVYQHKKTLAQGMMDLALFSANANQLRYVLESYSRHPYYYPSLTFIALSLLLQVAIGVGLTWNAIYNVKNEREICIANKINNFTIIGIFIVTVVNVFISAFGVAPPAPTV